MEQLAAQVEAHPNLEFDEVKAELISLPTLGEKISAVEKILELDRKDLPPQKQKKQDRKKTTGE